MEKISWMDLLGIVEKGVRETEEEEPEIVVSDFIPVTLMFELAYKICDACVTTDENGIHEIDYAAAGLMSKSMYAKIASNIDFGDLSLWDVCDVVEEIQIRYPEFCPDYYSLWSMVKEMFRKYENENAHHDNLYDISLIMKQFMESMGVKIGDFIDRADPNKISKYLSKGIEILAKKCPDFSDPEQAGKSLDAMIDVVKKLK